MSQSLYPALIEKCDGFYSKLIRLIHPTCYFPLCGKKSEEACHTIGRAKLGTRWDVKNGMGGCTYHNRWEKDHEEEAHELKIQMLGERTYGYLEERAKQGESWKPTLEDLEYIADGLEQELRNLGEKNIRVRNFNKVRREQAKKQRDAALQRFKDEHGGKSPYQVAYQRKKDYLKNRAVA